ncbi:sensor histidine kinase [Cytobacillus sp. IB215316]|uniref:sensor histidine kinase n=1 Tax=Cytobacillus sp. IB215316 TaxID=3097354 RepID=UPI002A17C163|nr:sensor histidine kinase [Cytobacillus sp. IB215316]MDX8361188.1 sensor histidine kinase [Cytobacillus sp. IB215316]
MTKKFNTLALDNILKKMIETVDSSKGEIFLISEQSRTEYEKLNEELLKTKILVNDVIDEGDKLDTHEKFARQRLVEVSRHFDQYSESQVRGAYEQAHALQMNLSMVREREKQLRDRRDDLERRILALSETIERADHLMGQISVVLNYLNSDFRQVGELLEDAIQKQDFGLRIIEGQEEERKRLSREIHDGPAQMLANVMMRSELIDRLYRERGAEEAFKEIRDLRTMVRSTLSEVRRIIYDLRPMALDDLGLIPTLKKYLSTVEEYNQVVILFLSIGKEKRLPARLEVALFRLAQESVQNAIKHAESSKIQVKIEIGVNNVILVIKDDGKGFNIHEKKENAFGLIGMNERVDLLEGEMTVDSKVGVGTVIMIRIPIPV